MRARKGGSANQWHVLVAHTAASAYGRAGLDEGDPIVKFSLFDTTSWPHGAEPGDYRPELAVELFEQHLQEYTAAEQLGYDTVFLAEHHFSPYNLTPNPFLMLAAIAQRTETIRMGVMISVLTFHSPVEFAEQVAMMDLLCRGRLEVGIGRGVDEQEFIKLGMRYEDARARFEESLDLVLRLWRDDEVEHVGRFFQLGGKATMWPRPLQPRLPIWVAALSEPTLKWAGANGYSVSSAFLPAPLTKTRFDIYREAAAAAGHDAGPDKTAMLRFVHVAEDHDTAVEEATEGLAELFKLFIPAVVPRDLSSLPPEYDYYREFFAPFQDPANPPPAEVLMQLGILVAGTPDEVEENLRTQVAESTSGHILTWHHFGNIPYERVRRSEELFATRVIEKLRQLDPVPA